MIKTWPLQDAKNRFSELIDRAINDGPQRVTRRGKLVAVVIAADEYEKLVVRKSKSLLEFFQSSPLTEVSLDLQRSRDEAREIEL